MNCVIFEDHRKRKPLDLDNMEHKSEVTKFKKYPKLAPEMHHHILTYCNDSTRFNYSLCSTKCNSAIQPFNKTPPTILEIKERSDGITVKMRYPNGRWIKKKFNVMEQIEEYFMKYYKYVGQKQTEKIVVDMRNWPVNLMKWKNISNIEHWDVTIFGSMYNDLMDYLKNTDLHITELTLKNYSSSIHSDRATVRSNVFKTDVFQNLQKADLRVNTEIDSEDFINLKTSTINFSSPIRYADLCAKIQKWNSENQSEGIRMKIYYLDGRNLDINYMLPFAGIQQGIIFEKNEWHERYLIGNVVAEIDSSRNALFLYFKAHQL